MASVSVLYQRFSGISRGYKVGTLARNGLKSLQTWVCIEVWNVNTVGDDPWIFFCIWLQNNLEIPQYSTICLSVRSKKHARRRHVTGTQSYSENFFRVIRGISAEKRMKLMSELNRSCCSTKKSHWEKIFSVACSFDKTLVQLKWKK